MIQSFYSLFSLKLTKKMTTKEMTEGLNLGIKWNSLQPLLFYLYSYPMIFLHLVLLLTHKQDKNIGTFCYK